MSTLVSTGIFFVFARCFVVAYVRDDETDGVRWAAHFYATEHGDLRARAAYWTVVLARRRRPWSCCVIVVLIAVTAAVLVTMTEAVARRVGVYVARARCLLCGGLPLPHALMSVPPLAPCGVDQVSGYNVGQRVHWLLETLGMTREQVAKLVLAHPPIVSTI